MTSPKFLKTLYKFCCLYFISPFRFLIFFILSSHKAYFFGSILHLGLTFWIPWTDTDVKTQDHNLSFAPTPSMGQEA